MTSHRWSTTFPALAAPPRRAILSRLLMGECSVGDLAEPFEMSMPAVSKHLRVLERAGLIAQRRGAQRRRGRNPARPPKESAPWNARKPRDRGGRPGRRDHTDT